MEWECLVSFTDDYTQLCDASPFCELTGCSINKLNSVRIYFESSLDVLGNENVLLQKMLITHQKINCWKRFCGKIQNQDSKPRRFSPLWGLVCHTPFPSLGWGFQAKPPLPAELRRCISEGQGLAREDPNLPVQRHNTQTPISSCYSTSKSKILLFKPIFILDYFSLEKIEAFCGNFYPPYHLFSFISTGTATISNQVYL